MRLRFSLVAPVALGLLAGCSPDSDSGPEPYLELVGSARFLSANRTIITPGDTLTTRLYTEATDRESPLRRLRIIAKYTPGKNPLLYPVGYDPRKATDNPEELVYLDSALSTTDPPLGLAFQFTFGARTTSGQEQWRFESEDTRQHTTSRSYRLTLRSADSALVYHRYTVRLQAPQNVASRSFLALLPGLALPKYTVRTSPGNQKLIDLAYLPTATGAPSLSSLTDPLLNLGSNWSTKRATRFKLFSLTDSTSFGTANTAQSFAGFYGDPNGPALLNTGPLRRKQTVAFLTADGKYGLFQVQEIRTTPTPALILQVRIGK